MNPVSKSTTLAIVFGLMATVSVRADDEVYRAATQAGNGAQNGSDAAASALKAAQAAEKAIDAAKQDANAKDSADAAAKAAATAGDKADEAVSKAEAANKAAKQAQAAHQKGDETAAKAAADDAASKAQQAKAAADAAKAAADDAASKANAAENRLKNDQTNGIVDPPTSQDQKDLDKEKQAAKEAESQAKDRAQDAKNLKDQSKNLIDEEAQKEINNDEKNKDMTPGEKRVEVPYRINSFFDIFVDPLPPSSFPNHSSPLVVPELFEKPKTTGLLELKLTNDNAFDVKFVGVNAGMFGDAVTFSQNWTDTIIHAGMTETVVLGRVTFDGPPQSYTFGDFSLISESDHPGLGPEFSANFSVVPEPSTLVMSLIAALGIGSFAWWRKPQIVV